MPRRYYSSTAARTTLASGVDDTTTTFTVVAVSGWPASYPYTLIIDQDTINEEVVSVTNRSGTTLTVTRGVDGTSAVSHSAGAAVNHGVSARDFNEPNQFLNEGGTVTGETVISSSGSGTTLEVRNTGSGNSFVVEDSANPDSTPFVINNAGKVGVGEASPVAPLHVTNNGSVAYPTPSPAGDDFVLEHNTSTGMTIFSANNSGGQIYFGDNDDSDIGALQYSHTDDAMLFRTNNAERMRITNAGRVGIGTSNPDRSITVYDASNSRMRLDGDATTDFVLRRASTNGSSSQFYMDKARGSIASPSSVAVSDVAGQIYFRGHDGTGFLTSSLISAEIDGTPGTNDMPGRLMFYTTADGASSPTERMRITSAGNVGIGTSSPAQKLDVSGAAATDGSAPVALRISDTTSGSSWTAGAKSTALQFYSADGTVSSGTAGVRVRSEIATVQNETTAASSSLIFSLDNGTNTGLYERMRITSAGNVGIGVTPTTMLHIQGSAPIITLTDSDTGADSQVSANSTTGSLILSADVNSESASSTIRMLIDATERFSLDANGLITGTGTSLGAWTAYTPTLTASTTNPTLGTGSTASGAYCQIGKVVHFRARIEFGTSGMAAGTGDYYVSLPVTAWSGYPASFPIGYVVIQDQSTGTRYNGLAVINSTTTVRLDMSSTNANSIAAADASPMAWAASDDIWINGTYEIA